MTMMAPVVGAPETGVFLASFLQPFRAWLEDPQVTEILVNQPGELWVERAGDCVMSRHLVPQLDAAALQRLAQQVARVSHQGISRESPLLAATLPDGARIQIVAPPATRSGTALAIRKHVMRDMSLDEFARAGAFGAVRTPTRPGSDMVRDELVARLEAGDIAGFLRAAVRARQTILLSGGTSSGKTTMLNALIKEVPADERVVVIEDTAEIRLDRANALGLVAVHGAQGEARIGVDDLLRASLRLRPDRLLIGELRGPEAVTFLRAINTGHPGSFATIHATSTDGAFEQIGLMCVQAGLGLRRTEAIDYARAMIDIVVQLGREAGRRTVTDIAFGRGAA